MTAPNQVHNGKKPGEKKWNRVAGRKYRKRVDPTALENMVA